MSRRGDPLWDLDGPEYENEPRESAMRTISVYGEHEEQEDPDLVERRIRDGFYQLDATGYHDRAVALVDEFAIAFQLQGYLAGRKSSSQAKKDCDWERMTADIKHCQSRDDLFRWKLNNVQLISLLPLPYREPLEEEFHRRMIELEEDE